MSAVSRRAVLGAGALAMAAEPFVSPAAAVAATGSGRRLYVRSRFIALRGKTFRLDTGASSRAVRLASVVGDDRSFALTFTVQGGGLPQGTYVLRRGGFEATSLLVVPIDRSGRTLEAIVNPG